MFVQSDEGRGWRRTERMRKHRPILRVLFGCTARTLRWAGLEQPAATNPCLARVGLRSGLTHGPHAPGASEKKMFACLKNGAPVTLSPVMHG